MLLIGESDVGKTHYGAQLLRRLINAHGALRMDGQATNLEPFEAALSRLDEGRAAGHTAGGVYLDSHWPVIDAQGRKASLLWPEYGGEQIKSIIEMRRVPLAWQQRIDSADIWLLLVRLQQSRVGDDIFSKPLADFRGTSTDSAEVRSSDPARLVELLQMLLFARDAGATSRPRPRLGVLLTCWDEPGGEGLPAEAFASRLPLVSAFVKANWSDALIMGLSALERPLSPEMPDMDYATQGPEHFGYVITPHGERDSDLTAPIHALIGG
ncbi:hypothetical protein [Brevundimonas sp.]|uniref:TRAFAC clade GTPase domain-containing protein n=1 Tax=Brevundimonas sp. TaxID=1871086 RepID=UPI00289D4A67|nr:hypothetical protein [Brevundimonas sp.]